MEIKYQILPFLTKEERRDVISKSIMSAAYPKFQFDILTDNKGKIDIGDLNTKLSDAFIGVLEECDFFQGYIKFVDFYESPHLIRNGNYLDKNIKIERIANTERSGYTKDKVDGEVIFIAINLEKVELELEIAKRRLTLAKSLLRGDTSLLNILPLELIINISHHIHEILELKNNQGGGAKYNKIRKKEYDSKKRKYKKKKKKKITKSKKRKRRSKKTKKR